MCLFVYPAKPVSTIRTILKTFERKTAGKKVPCGPSIRRLRAKISSP
jgi:hypothetical protein